MLELWQLCDSQNIDNEAWENLKLNIGPFKKINLSNFLLGKLITPTMNLEKVKLIH